MAPVSRRALLRAGLVSAGVALAGCSESVGSSSPTPDSATGTPTETPSPKPFETPASDECAALQRPQPTPVAGYEPREYPEYPDSLDSETAESFAAEFEEAYRHNRYLATEAGDDTESLELRADPQSNRTERVDGGFLVAVDGFFSTSERNREGDTVITDDYLFAVYYAGPDVALRRGYEGTPRDADSLWRLAEGGTPVVCRD
jgi:hypothetical protein